MQASRTEASPEVTPRSRPKPHVLCEIAHGVPGLGVWGLGLGATGAAVVLGGTSLFGGQGGVIGTFFAVLLLQVLRNIFNLLGLGSFYQMTVTGVIIVLAILLNRWIDLRRIKH